MTRALASVSAAQRGTSMIEVLVALLIVSLGVLAMAGLLGVSTRLGKTSEFRAVATLLASDLADRMRANQPGAAAGNYTLTTSGLRSTAVSAAAACASTTLCTAAELAAIDLAEWQATLYNNLPKGTGYISYASGSADVWVIWRDPDAQAAATSSDNALIESGVDKRCPPSFATTDKPSCMYFRLGL